MTRADTNRGFAMFSLRCAAILAALLLCSIPSTFLNAVRRPHLPSIGTIGSAKEAGLVNFPDFSGDPRHGMGVDRVIVVGHSPRARGHAPVDYPNWFADEDGDGFGAGTPATGAPRIGWVSNNEDCAPDNPTLPVLHWRDADDDGYGDPASSSLRCAPGRGWVDNDADCDDNDRRSPTVQWLDLDRDGLGRNGTEIGACEPLPLHVPRAGDCDDDDPLVRACM